MRVFSSYDLAQQTGVMALAYGALSALSQGDFLSTGNVGTLISSLEAWLTLAVSSVVGAGLWHHRQWALWAGAFGALVQLIRLDLSQLVNDVAYRPGALATVFMIATSLLLILFLTMLMQPGTQEACDK